MICVFAQTHGDKRSKLFDWKIRDENMNFFISQFDHSILSFHNSPDEYRKDILKKYNVFKETKIFNGIFYAQCIERIVEYVKENNFSKLIFLSDDAFSVQKDREFYEELVDFIKNSSHDMICLEYEGNPEHHKILENRKNFNVFNTTNHDLVKSDPKIWHFDDAAFVANVKFLDTIYSKEFFAADDRKPFVQDGGLAERILKSQMQQKVIPRYVLDKKSLVRCNLIGPSSNSRSEKWLIDRFN
jgi:hypothetical protein